MAQKNSSKFEQLGTKIDPAMAEVLNSVCDALQVDVYHLLQWFAYAVIRAASPTHRLDPRIQKLMTLLESEAGWQEAFNMANPDKLRIAQCILILEQEKHKGYGAVMIDKPFMSEARQTECADDILEPICEVTMRGIYRRLRLLGADMECNNLSDILLTMLDRQTALEDEDNFTKELPTYGDRAENNRPYAYGKRTKAKHRRTPDSLANDRRIQRTITFDDDDRQQADKEAGRDEPSVKPFGVEW